MPFDRRGQLHAGNIGLFDDDDEYYRTQARLDRNQTRDEVWAQRLDEQELRRDERGHRKAEKKNQKRLERARSPGHFSWIMRIIRKKKESTQPPTSGFWVSRAATPSRSEEENYERQKDSELEGEVNPKPEMYDVDEVDSVLDSPFYQELGLVVIKADRATDVKVVNRSQIRPNEKQEF